MTVNLTQHKATEEQKAAYVRDLPDDVHERVKQLLTFNEPPTPKEMRERAEQIARIAKEHNATGAMIGGAPYLMRYLETALLDLGIGPMYAFSKRISEETVVNGEVRKTSRFKHVGFVSVPWGEEEEYEEEEF